MSIKVIQIDIGGYLSEGILKGYLKAHLRNYMRIT
jgi:hypothetical protein